MTCLVLPDLPLAKEIIIAADNDKNGAGLQSAQKAAEKWIKEGRKVSISFPPNHNDFNDLLRDNSMKNTEISSIVNNATPVQTNKSRAKIINMEDVEMKAIKWLWKDRIALGKLSVIAGQPGLGKSQITAMLCAHITAQVPFPDNFTANNGSALIISAEDDIEDTIKPRLIAAGAIVLRIKNLSCYNHA